MEFVKDFLIYEAGALCGFFIAALMNAARAGQEIAIKFEEDKHPCHRLEVRFQRPRVYEVHRHQGGWSDGGR